MNLRTCISLLILGLGVGTACGRSEGGDDDLGTGGAGAAGGTGGTQSGDWLACELNSDCVLAATSCCGVCGRPALGDVDAINRHRLDQHFEDVCPEPVPCPKCAAETNANLQATCDAGACLALDIGEHPASACSTDADCRLRVTGCCECGGSTAPWDLIAIRSDGEPAYQALVCDPEQACDECAPVYPTDVEAYCATDGHCATRPADDCDSSCAAQGMTCCGGKCVLTYNDVLNCGECGNACPESAPYCDGNACAAAPCDDAGTCGGSELCCGSECCAPGELCCSVPGPGPSGLPGCHAPNEAGTCPVGCPLCE